METIEDIYKPATLAKARKLLSNEYAVQRDAEDESVWWAKGSTGSKYRVQLLTGVTPEESIERDLAGDTSSTPDGFVPLLSCTCPNGMNRGGRPQCYHTAAVLLMLEEGKEPHIMENPDPVDEAFVQDDEIARLKAEGYTDTEIEFLRS